MIASLVHNLVNDLTGRGPAGRLGPLALLLYLSLAAGSVVWGLSAPPVINNALGALVRWDTSQGTASLQIENHGDRGWTGVRVVLDGRYYLLVGEVPPNGQVLATPEEFSDGFQLPRPLDLFAYERFGEASAENEPLESRYLPRVIELRTDLGTIELTEFAP